jgi:hypothetical protein
MKHAWCRTVALLAALGGGTAWADTPPLLSNNTPLGAGFGLQIKEWRASGDDLDDIKDMGVQYLRFGFTWNVVERHRGYYDWGPSDFFMRRLASRNLYAVYELGGLNGGYSPTVDAVPDTPDGRARPMTEAPTSPEPLAAMEQFIAETVRRYHGDHVIWEFWNEPDMNSNWPPRSNASEFARVIGRTCAVIKHVDPHATVVGPALAYLPARNGNGQGNFLATILQSPAGACLDAISIHPYRHGDQPPESVVEDYAAIRAYIAKNTPPGRKILPIINSEWGYSLSEVTPEQQAAYVIRSFVIDRLSGIPVSIWYEYRDSFEDDETEIGKMDRESHFGIRDYDDDDKLSATVVKAILPRLRDSYVEKRVTFADDRIYALLLRDSAGQHQLLFWLADRVNVHPPGLAISDGATKTTYPVGLIPTLVCLNTVPDLAVTPGPINRGQEYYVPCRQ